MASIGNQWSRCPLCNGRRMAGKPVCRRCEGDIRRNKDLWTRIQNAEDVSGEWERVIKELISYK